MAKQKNKQNKRNARTYARNRTSLNRRGFEKNPESDGIFILKLIICVILGSFWLKFAAQIDIFGINFGGFPIGTILGIMLIHWFEKRQNNRKIFFAVLVLAMIVSYFVPSGIVI